MTMGDFYTTLSPTDRAAREKIITKIQVINCTLKMELTDIYRTFHPTRKTILFFLISPLNFLKN